MSSCPDNDVSRMATLCAGSVLALRLASALCGGAVSAAPLPLRYVLTALSPAVSIGGTYILFRYLAEMMPFGALLEERTAVKHVRLCLLFAGAASGGILIARALSYLCGISAEAEMPAGAELFWYAAANCVLAPILEEALFRGAMLSRLRPQGDGFAVPASAVLFALAHTSALLWPSALLCGAALGICTLATGSLRLPVLLHAAYNFAQLAMLCGGISPPSALLAVLFVLGAAQVRHCVRIDGEAVKSAMLMRFFLAPAMLLLYIAAVLRCILRR